MTCLCGLILFLVIGSAPREATVWDMSLLERFDPGNQHYAISEGQVVVDLDEQGSLCPTGLGQVSDGRESVKEIVIRYSLRREEKLWLHVAWNPGGSGSEQFEVAVGDAPAQKSKLVKGAESPYMKQHSCIALPRESRDARISLRHLSGDGLRFHRITLARTSDPERLPHSINPALKFTALASYEKEIAEKGVLLDSDHVRLYAPRKKQKEGKTVFKYLVKAYDEFFRIVGMHTDYRIIVYHFPEGNPHHKGGTSECTIWYGYPNLEFESHSEWRNHHMPHVSGYIEEMGHNFTKLVTFGWEMTGWHIARVVCTKVAGNHTLKEHFENARRKQAQTFAAYRALGNTIPPDLESNLSDRIHGHLLWKCEERYGSRFWRDFFAEIRAVNDQLIDAGKLGDGDARRDARYRITVDCLARLDEKRRLLDRKRRFKEMLAEYGISRTRALKSLRPMDEGWDRKLE